MASFFVDWPKYLDFGVVDSTITECKDYFGNQTEYGVFQLSSNQSAGSLEGPECINFSIFNESKLLLGCFIGVLGLLAVFWLVFGHLLDKVKIQTERQVDDLSTGEFYGLFGIQMKFSINQMSENTIFDLYLLFEGDNGEKKAIIYRDANKKMAKNNALTLSVDEDFANNVENVSICLYSRDSKEDYYGYISSMQIFNDGTKIGTWKGSRSLFALQPSIINLSKKQSKSSYLALTKIFPKIEEILISMMVAVLVYSSFLSEADLNSDDQVERIRAMKDANDNGMLWFNRMFMASIFTSIPTGIIFKIFHILLEYETESISHVPVIESNRQLKVTENGENTWINCLLGQTEPCPQASALIFSRMIHKKGFIRGEHQRAVFMKGTKAKLGYKITTKIDEAGERKNNGTEFFAMDQRKFSLMLEDIEITTQGGPDTKVPQKSNSIDSDVSNFSRLTARASSKEMSVVPSSINVRESIRGMMVKTVKSEPMEDFESKRSDSARSASKLRRASNPEAENESEEEGEESFVEELPIQDGRTTNPLLNSRIWEPSVILKENEWLIRPEDIPGSDPKRHDPTGESVTVVNPIFHPEMFDGVDEKKVDNLTDLQEASDLISEAYRNNPSMLSVPSTAVPGLEPRLSRRMTEQASRQLGEHRASQQEKEVAPVPATIPTPIPSEQTAPPTEEKRRRRKKTGEENTPAIESPVETAPSQTSNKQAAPEETTIVKKRRRRVEPPAEQASAPAEQVAAPTPVEATETAPEQTTVVKKRRRRVEPPAEQAATPAPEAPVEPATTQVVVKKKRRRKVVDPALEPSQGAQQRHWRKRITKIRKLLAPVAEIIFFVLVLIVGTSILNASLFKNENELFLTHAIGLTFISQILWSTTLGDFITEKVTRCIFG